MIGVQPFEFPFKNFPYVKNQANTDEFAVDLAKSDRLPGLHH